MPSTFAGDLTSILASETSATLRTVTTVRDIAAGTNVPTPTNTPVKARLSSFTVEEMESSEVQRGDMKAAIAAAGINEPTTAAKLIVDSVVWNIVRVKPSYGLGTVVGYQLHLRR